VNGTFQPIPVPEAQNAWYQCCWSTTTGWSSTSST